MTTQTLNKFEEGLLRYLTKDQLTLIQSKHIAIGGAGGLGSNIAMILVRSGFKNLEVLDFDIIDESNLNRQQYFYHEVGKQKVDITKQRLLDINPDLNIKTYSVKWTPSVGNQYFQNADFYIEAFDQADNKYMFVDYYSQFKKPLISGVGMAGLLEKEEMKIKKMGNIYICGDLNTDAACGNPPMSPRVTQCAAMMAEIVLDLTLGVKR